MNQLLGLIDTLEAMILETKKIPLTNKIILQEDHVLTIIDKIRKAVKSNGEIIQQSISVQEKVNALNKEDISVNEGEKELEKAEKIKKGAEEYANYILTNLQLAVTKMQSNLIKLEKNIESGRKIIDDKIQAYSSVEEEKKEQVNETI